MSEILENTSEILENTPLQTSTQEILPSEHASEQTRCGYIAIVGRPNVGKSTLMNKILGQKISITCRKPQTTRHQILGIQTLGENQLIFVDTPGIHENLKGKAMNRFMNRTALNAIQYVNVVLWLIEPFWTEGDDRILAHFQGLQVPVILGINKVDTVKDRGELLPYIQMLAKKFPFHSIVPMSGKQGIQIEALESLLGSLLPKAPFMFGEDEVTDRSERFMVAEIVREKLMRSLGQELPYELTVEVEWFKELEDGRSDIAATIFVERETQKRMVIGKNGEKLKQIGTEARLDLNKLLGRRVHLQLWVKVKSGWSDDERALQSLGYRD